MAADPFAFYRGSACLFYADTIDMADPWVDQRTSRVWIQGDLHAENSGTYMNSEGQLVFDEPYLGHFTWDLLRFVASIALMGWQKTLSEDDISALVPHYVNAYLDQVFTFAEHDNDDEFSLRLGNTEGTVHDVLQQARMNSRFKMLRSMTTLDGYEPVFRNGSGVRRLGHDEYERVAAAFAKYLETIPPEQRYSPLAYRIKDIVGKSGFTDWCTRFAHRYAAQVRADHALFVDAFRNNEITGVRSSDPV